ncbi:MAG: Crp/Fnr family transcriptional regulator [Flavobacteriaceae bacterium]|nr:Crp/Fnr family transcriptional regulator [Flavobacteriaceae bacterium]
MINFFFKKLNILEEELKTEIAANSYISEHRKGDVLIKENEYIKVLKIVLKGRVRVFQEREDRQILIYYLNDIETCIHSLSACFKDCKSTVNAIVETETSILNIPVRFVNDWSFKYKSWHNFTINTFSESYHALMSSYSELAFNNLKERILIYILHEANEQNHCTISMSHQRLANEFGTTRVVVSRLLKQLEKESLLKLGQKQIQIIR